MFDGAICEMAVMDIDDIHGAVHSVGAVVRPGGWFVISMVHPCFPGDEVGLSSWPPEQCYFREGRWSSPAHNPQGVRVRVGSSHRTEPVPDDLVGDGRQSGARGELVVPAWARTNLGW